MKRSGLLLLVALLGCSVANAPDDPSPPATGGTDAVGGSAGSGAAAGSGTGGTGASGGTSATGGSGGGAGGGGDTVAPTIVSITPPDGATGVASDADIVVQFSERMNPTATEGAYQSTDLAPGAVSFSWNGAGDTLTIDPNADLSYATGTDPASVTALEYAFSITAAATDVAGNPLAAQTDSSFFTLREITTTITADQSLSGDVRSDGMVNGCFGGDPCAGDSGSLPNAPYHGFYSYDLSTLPANITTFVSATLTASQIAVSGNPYTGMGVVNLEHVEFSALDLTAFGTTALASLGVLSGDATVTDRSLDVTAAVQTNYTDPSPLNTFSQYRLSFTNATDNDGAFDAARFARSTSTLEIVYQLP